MKNTMAPTPEGVAGKAQSAEDHTYPKLKKNVDETSKKHRCCVKYNCSENIRLVPARSYARKELAPRCRNVEECTGN